jgi:hypothetical protein
MRSIEASYGMAEHGSEQWIRALPDAIADGRAGGKISVIPDAGRLRPPPAGLSLRAGG